PEGSGGSVLGPASAHGRGERSPRSPFRAGLSPSKAAQPIMPPSFRALGVPAEIADALAARGLDEPFPIQAATLPDSLAGRDVRGRAPRGSGQTLALGVAVPGRPDLADRRRPRGHALVPARVRAARGGGELSRLLAPVRATAVAV